MVRITTHTVDSALVLKLEGCLSGPWVHELDNCWREAMRHLNGRQLRVDLTAVCHADDEGRELMTQMYEAGAHFVTRGCVMPELVREISEAAGARPSQGS